MVPVGDDAVGRYKTYLHAIGDEDVADATMELRDGKWHRTG